MRKYVLAFLGLAILLTACRIESNIILDINEDGSAIVGAEVGFDEEMLDLMSQGGGDPSDLLDELPDLGGDGVEPIQRTEGDMTFYGASTQVDDLSTYDFDGFQGESFSEFAYEFDDNSATLAAEVDATGIGDLGGDDLPIDPSEITADIFAARVRISMPGTVTEHNADEVAGDGTLIWNLPLTGTKAIVATSTFGSTAPSWIWFVVGGIVIVGIAAVIAAVMKSRKDSQEAVAAAAATAQQSTAEQPPAEEDQIVEEEPSADSSPASAEEPEAIVIEDALSPGEPSDGEALSEEARDGDDHPADEDAPDA